MFEIQSIIWVVPGLIGLLTYNAFLPVKLPQIEGWAYFFAVVFFATPYYFISLLSSDSLDSLLEIIFLQKIDVWLSNLPQELSEPIKKLGISIVMSFLLGILVAEIRTVFGIPVYDPFRECCYLWRGKFIFITLKNNKIYIALLIDYTKDSRFERTIKVMPVHSGYRDEQGKPQWISRYPIDELLDEESRGVGTTGVEHSLPKLIIPYKEIVIFSLWSHSKAYKNAPQIGA